MELAGCCEGCHISCCWEGYNGACWLQRRLPHKLQAAAKASTLLGRLQCCWEGFHVVGKAATLIKRLQRRQECFNVVEKDAIKALVCYEGCHISCRLPAIGLLQRLPGYYKDAKLLRRLPGYCEGCQCCEGCQATAKAARLLLRLPGYYEGYQATTKAARLLRRLSVY
ncbi:hypothetical protein Tco_0063677 [Tanacetum coccineum]